MHVPDNVAPMVMQAVKDAIRYHEGLLQSDTIPDKSDYEEYHLELCKLYEVLAEEYRRNEKVIGIPLSEL